MRNTLRTISETFIIILARIMINVGYGLLLLICHFFPSQETKDNLQKIAQMEWTYEKPERGRK